MLSGRGAQVNVVYYIWHRYVKGAQLIDSNAIRRVKGQFCQVVQRAVLRADLTKLGRDSSVHPLSPSSQCLSETLVAALMQ